MTIAGRHRIGVIGGGSAGYLAALALRTQCPAVEVTLIESSKQAIIGVGEGTTPVMLPFLHGYLGIDLAELISEVQPTWKIGVSLDWGPKGGEAFQFPFSAPYLSDSYVRTGTINHAGLASELMNRRCGLHMIQPDLSLKSLAPVVPFAYHLENQRFVKHLAKVARRAGVRWIDAHLVDHKLADGGDLASVRADDGREFAFDLFVDCSGFRSALLGGVLGVGFKSYASSLFTDAALAGAAPHHGKLAPYTGCDTLDAGWCWSVPQLEEDRRGYVFSTDHLSPDAAEAEMRRHCPGLGEVRLVRFAPGRRTAWWVRNVVAIGNSYGFVEPLQATALHMIVHEAVMLVKWIRKGWPLNRGHESVNQQIAAIWDDICALIALHYKYNFRRNTAFWRRARAEVDLLALTPVIREAIRTGSVSRLVARGDLEMGSGAARDVDLVLLGLRLVRADQLNTTVDDEGWAEVRRRLSTQTAQALSAASSVKASRRQPRSVNFEEAAWYSAIVGLLKELPKKKADGAEMPVLLSVPAITNVS